VRILVVDDSPLVRSRLVAMLRVLPCVSLVNEAGTLAAARAALGGLRPDVVILDLQLADGDGLAILRDAKRLREPPAVAVLTNHADDWYRVRCDQAGADFFLDKSKQFDRIPAIVARLTAARVPTNG
jgi:DNA-binding NarL/FixJ family response regulator